MLRNAVIFCPKSKIKNLTTGSVRDTLPYQHKNVETKMEHHYQEGDLVVLKHDDYKNLRAGIIGIVRGMNGKLVNVTFPEGTWAFPKFELKPLTKEAVCK